MTENTDTDRQALRKWCIELAATEPTDEGNGGACTRQIVATAATYEDFILNGAQSKELDALFTKVESAWEVRDTLYGARRYQQNEVRKKQAQLIAAAQAFATPHEPQQENAKDAQHLSDCALHNGPAFAPGPCDCGAL